MKMISKTALAGAGVVALMAAAGTAAAPALAAHSAPARTRAAGAAAPSALYPGHPLIPATGQEQHALAQQQSRQTVGSYNWAGYAATRKGTTFRHVSATFFVPYMNCSSATGTGNRFSSHWAGLDGFSSQTVEQDGIEADCFGTTATYHAWIEFYPKAEQRISLQVRPGQSVTASVSYSRSSKKFTLAIYNNTTGHHYSTALRCAHGVTCKRNSAEVISEAPTLIENGQLKLANLADYGAVGYSGIAIRTTKGADGGLTSRSWNTTKILQVSQTSPHPTVAQPTTTRSGSFSVYWLREN